MGQGRVLISTGAMGVLLFVCSPPPDIQTVPGAASVDLADTVATDTAPTVVEGFRALEPPEWVGQSFVMVEKVKMFRQYGYLLHTTPFLEREPAPANPEIELKNHRLRYEPFAGTRATVTKVEPADSGEHLVTFRTDTMGLEVYGLTRDGIVEGLCAADDLEGARERWLGKVVYSRRKLVDVYDTLGSKFVAVKVSITRPLTVEAVQWGMTPLPPKPIWLVVRASDGSGGIIPVNYTWTNVLPAKRTAGPPWALDILEGDPREYGWSEAVWEAIDESRILTDMTGEQVRLSWGDPLEERVLPGVGEYEFVYAGNTLVFRNDTLAESR